MSDGDWHVSPSVLTVPPFMDPAGAGIILGQSSRDGSVYPELAALYAPGTVVGAIIDQLDRFDYVYQAYVIPNIGLPFWAVGAIESVSATLREAYRVVPGALGAVPFFDVRALTNVLVPNGSTGGLTIQGNYISGAEVAAYHTVTVGGAYSGGAFANIPEGPAVQIVKRYDSTRSNLVAHLDMTLFTAAPGASAEIAVRDGTTDWVLFHGGVGDAANFERESLSGTVAITGLNAGTYTITPRWRIYAGATALNNNADDSISIHVRETMFF